MRSFAPLALALALGACAGNPASDVLPGEQSATATARQVVNGVGTPVHAVLKGASCVATTVVAVPLASFSQITGEPQARQEEAYQAVGRTCGGDYVLGSPSERLPASEPPPSE
jgi:hypothetical protein